MYDFAGQLLMPHKNFQQHKTAVVELVAHLIEHLCLLDKVQHYPYVQYNEYFIYLLGMPYSEYAALVKAYNKTTNISSIVSIVIIESIYKEYKEEIDFEVRNYIFSDELLQKILKVVKTTKVKTKLDALRLVYLAKKEIYD